MGWENRRIGQRTQRHIHGILCFALKITRAGYLLSRIPTDWSSWRGGTHIGPLYDPSGARTQGGGFRAWTTRYPVLGAVLIRALWLSLASIFGEGYFLVGR